MAKGAVLAAFIQQREEEIQKLEADLWATIKELQETPKTKKDSLDRGRSDLQAQLIYLQNQLRHTQDCCLLLKDLPINYHQIICLGSLVALRDCASNECETYFLVPKNGGHTVQRGDKRIMCISIQVPLAQAILHKQRGDKINFRGNTYEVIAVE